jgi:hypothetical protein
LAKNCQLYILPSILQINLLTPCYITSHGIWKPTSVHKINNCSNAVRKVFHILLMFFCRKQIITKLPLSDAIICVLRQALINIHLSCYFSSLKIIIICRTDWDKILHHGSHSSCDFACICIDTISIGTFLSYCWASSAIV